MTAELKPGGAGYSQWRKAIMGDDALRAHAMDARKAPGGGVDIRMVGFAIAEHGANGRDCFPKAETIAAEVGCSVRTVKTCRAYLIGHGWFTVTARNAGHGRAIAVDISLPAPPELGWCIPCQAMVPGGRARNQQWFCGDHMPLPVAS
jgi:hypothetical protein